jgi:hypothetical protein
MRSSGYRRRESTAPQPHDGGVNSLAQSGSVAQRWLCLHCQLSFAWVQSPFRCWACEASSDLDSTGVAYIFLISYPVCSTLKHIASCLFSSHHPLPNPAIPRAFCPSVTPRNI